MKIPLAMNSIRIKFLVMIFITSISLQNIAYGQVNTDRSKSDSLILSDVIKVTLDNYPTIKSAEENLNAADYKIDLAKTGYLPDIDFTANYTFLNPVAKVTIPNMGTFQFTPENNYSASLNYRQSIYDFGKTAKNVSVENVGKELSKQSLNLIKNKVAISVITNFYYVLYFQKAIIIKQQEINTLNEHLDYINKKKETGSAIDYDILSTQVKVSTVESQKLDLEGALRIQTVQLNSFMGRLDGEPCYVKDNYFVMLPQVNADSILSYAFLHREEMQMAKTKTNLAEIKFELIKTQNMPSLNLFASGGYKNGYTPYLNDPKLNFVAGVNFRVPIFDANRTKYNRNIAKSSVITTNLENESLKRNISNEVVECKTNVDVASKKVHQFELQLAQALKAFKMAKIRFQEGTITNLDLLDASNSVSESQLLLMKSKIDYTVSVYKLKVALGDKLY